jgi:hypothetical protein
MFPLWLLITYTEFLYEAIVIKIGVIFLVMSAETNDIISIFYIVQIIQYRIIQYQNKYIVFRKCNINWIYICYNINNNFWSHGVFDFTKKLN